MPKYLIFKVSVTFYKFLFHFSPKSALLLKSDFANIQISYKGSTDDSEDLCSNLKYLGIFYNVTQSAHFEPYSVYSRS